MVGRPRAGRLQKVGSKVVAAIGRQEWMDRPSYRFEHLLSFAYNGLGSARNTVTNALNGVWLGHPVHPPLVSDASGGWTRGPRHTPLSAVGGGVWGPPPPL